MAVTQAIYDVVVGSSSSDATTLTAGEALQTGSETMYVKAATYSESVTFSSTNIEVEFEPGTVVTGAVTLSGTGVCLIVGTECDFQSNITISGPDCSILCENGVDINGIDVTATGKRFFMDGGGMGTLINLPTGDGIDILAGADDCIVTNLQGNTPNQAGNLHSLVTAADRTLFLNIFSSYADWRNLVMAGADGLLMGCLAADSKGSGIEVSGARNRIIANTVLDTISSGGNGISTGAGTDDSIFFGNVIRSTADPININASADNVVLVGNRLDNAAVESSSTSTVALNDETAF